MGCPNCGFKVWSKKEPCEDCGFHEIETVKHDEATLVYCGECGVHYFDRCITHGTKSLEKVKV